MTQPSTSRAKASFRMMLASFAMSDAALYQRRRDPGNS
jgi:hypothetical protein